MATIFYDGELREIEQYPLTLKQKNGDIIIVISPNRLLHIVWLSEDPRIAVYGSTEVFDHTDELVTATVDEAVTFILKEFNKSMGLWTEAMNAAAAKPRKPENAQLSPGVEKEIQDKLFNALGFGKDLDDVN